MGKRILVALVGVPILLLVLLWLSPIYTPVLVALLAAVASFEMGRALGLSHPRIQGYVMLLAAGVPFWVYYGQGRLPALMALFVYTLLLFLEAMASGYKVNISLAAGVSFISFIAAYFLSALVQIRIAEMGRIYILLPLAIPFMSDAVAMFCGLLFGKHKLAPTISPKKSREGAVGGLLGGTVIAVLYGFVAATIMGVSVHYWILILYGFFGSAIAQIGDLSFSYIKRQNGIKDFGKIFPGHGGVLDRFDSVIFCTPFLAILIIMLPAFWQS